MVVTTYTTYEGFDTPVEASGAREGSDWKERSRVREGSREGGTWPMDGGIQHSPCHETPWQMDCCQSLAE